jgi:spore coat polysaccharide biosynthesis predicted glycosyltransferase SpsG
VGYHYDHLLRFNTTDILRELKYFIQAQADRYQHVLIYRASSPLVNHQDIQNGYELFLKKNADILVTLKKQQQRIWREGNGEPDQLICNDGTETVLIEIKSFIILKSGVLNDDCAQRSIVPYYLGDKAIDINGYQDWWICEKLLRQKRIVFVVTGHPAVGLGHVYRALTLAHEITDHRIVFLCTQDSELAVKRIAEKDYQTVLQTGSLLEDVLRLEPDLVINDILNTDAGYVQGLKVHNILVVNFEDDGPGADTADLVINALFPPDPDLPDRYLHGAGYFCLRDEFIDTEKCQFHKTVKNLLVTFGGTDPQNYTLKTLACLSDICRRNRIRIFVVTGPGYLHRTSLENYLKDAPDNRISYIHQTAKMSGIMQQCDLAISSAGRTLYELAHMRVPAIVMAQHEREDTHRFARPENGFEYLGVMVDFDAIRLADCFGRMIEPGYRRILYDRMKQHHFGRNKKKVIRKILSLLDEE